MTDPADLTIDVCRLRESSADLNWETGDGQGRVKLSATHEYQITYGPGYDAHLLSEFEAGDETGMPIVGQSVYNSPDGSLVYPYLLCVNKSVQRDTENARRFTATIEYDDVSGGPGAGGSSP